MLDLEKFNKLPSIRRNAAKYFLDALPEKQVVALLFGSTAKGIYTKDSDMDMLLIVNRRIKTEEAEKQAEAQTAVKISPVQITYSNFARELKLKRGLCHTISFKYRLSFNKPHNVLRGCL